MFGLGELKSPTYGGGFYTCSRCGSLIRGSVIHSGCRPTWCEVRKDKLNRILKVIKRVI